MKHKENQEKYKEWHEKHHKALKSVYDARRTDDNQAFLEYKRKIKADRESKNRLEQEQLRQRLSLSREKIRRISIQSRQKRSDEMKSEQDFNELRELL